MLNEGICIGADENRAHPYEEPAYEVYKLEDL